MHTTFFPSGEQQLEYLFPYSRHACLVPGTGDVHHSLTLFSNFELFCHVSVQHAKHTAFSHSAGSLFLQTCLRAARGTQLVAVVCQAQKLLNQPML